LWLYQAVEKVSQPVILSEAKDLKLKKNNELSDSSSPPAPQNDPLRDFFSSLPIYLRRCD